MPPSYFAEGKIAGKPGDILHHRGKGKWPGTYTIGRQRHEIITGEPLQYTAENIQGPQLLRLLSACAGAAILMPDASHAPRRSRGHAAGRERMRVTPVIELPAITQALRAGRGA